MRAMIASGTVTPGTSFARNSALRTETSGQMPAMIGMCTCSIALEELLELRHVEHRLRDRVLGARVDLPLEALELVLQIDRHRIHADADREARRLCRSRCRPDRARDSGCCTRFVRPIESTSKTAVASGYGPIFGGSPVMMSRLRSPTADAPSRSLSMPSRLRSRQA